MLSDRHIGGWVLHSPVSPSSTTTFKRECTVCHHAFESTLSKNCKVEDALIFLKFQVKKTGWFNVVERHEYEKVKRLIAVCPNCGNQAEIACIPSGVSDYGEWKIGAVD